MRSGAFSHRYCLQSPRMSQAASIAVPDRNNVRCDWPQDRRPKLVKGARRSPTGTTGRRQCVECCQDAGIFAECLCQWQRADHPSIRCLNS